MVELKLLKSLSTRDNFNKFKSIVNPKSLSTQSLILLKDFESYFQQNDTADHIDLGSFSPFFFTQRHPYFDDKSILEYREIMSQLEQTKLDKDCEKLLLALEQREVYERIQDMLDKNVDVGTVTNELSLFRQKFEEASKTTLSEDMDLQAALTYIDRTNGLKWRCQALRDHFNGGLIKGDFGIIAAYVDTGKTSFLVSEASYMAEQLDGDDYVLYLSNEGDWKSILPRVYCATLECTVTDLYRNLPQAIKKYTNVMKGNKNRLIIKDIQGWSTKDIEALIRKHPPKLLIIDLLDHVVGFDSYQNKNEGSTERYKKLYQWARQIATHHCPVLGVSQMNGDGENEMYVPMSRLSGSRVDKQGAATFQLNIGALEGNNTDRFLCMPKNKVNENKNWKVAVKFDPVRCRFV